MTFTILKRLKEIEQKFGIRIIYAAEMGSRAWGYEHPPTSDYDIRFIYVRPVDAYLSIDGPGKLTLDENNGLPTKDRLDFVGWDLMKFLDLAAKSNPQVLEWLNSPVVYINTHAAERVAQLASKFFDSFTARQYYWSMAKHNLLEHFRPDKSPGPSEKFLHIARPLLMVRWIEEFGKPNLPVNFYDLTCALGHRMLSSVGEELLALADAKAFGGAMPRLSQEVVDWASSEIARRDDCEHPIKKTNDRAEADKLFRSILNLTV